MNKGETKKKSIIIEDSYSEDGKSQIIKVQKSGLSCELHMDMTKYRKVAGQLMSIDAKKGGADIDIVGAGDTILNTCFASGDIELKTQFKHASKIAYALGLWFLEENMGDEYEQGN